ncbi:hypothetical protein BGX24_001629 [Mortierella sp. AD032]|nr:hypothetical protein BGX24_001629 [Mortierella sp. AD032]
MSNQKRSPAWRTCVKNLPHAQYFINEKRPQDFDHIAFLLYVKPSSKLRREITNQWLHVVIPALKTSTLSELQQAGSRLTNEWTSQEHDRDAFWLKVTADEEQKDRVAYLKAAGEKRLKAAESFLVAESQHHFETETAQLTNRPNQQKDRDHPNQQQQQDKDQQQEESNEEESQESNVEEEQTPPEGRLPQKKRKVDKAMHGQDPSGDDESVDTAEMTELIASITSVSHKECDTWVIDDECVGCLINKYQKEVIDMMRRCELKKTDPADTMILAGTFSPWHPTDRMVKVFTHRRLRKIQESLRKDLDPIDINDKCIQNAIRHKMNNNPMLAIQELGALQDYRLRMLFEHLIMNLPRKEMEMQSEETLVVNNIAPILKAFVNHVDDEIHTHFPNTESTTQKKQGLKADRPDFKVLIGDKEASFGEVTGRSQRADKAKNGWDLWRLVRFAEVGVFTVPMHLNNVGALQASLPVLNWYQEAVKWLEQNREWAKRSWKAADLQNIKKYHC